MNRMQSLIAERLEPRHALAERVVAAIVREAGSGGIVVTPVGSLARGDFRIHSDVDLLVRGPLSPTRRLRVEQIVVSHLRGTDIAYDLLFEADLDPARVEELLHDAVHAR
ncbi:nucleotidyltransferase domain-containing protein [Rhizobium rosettiformans]|uniref:Nucleotidyltransferase domain-containing protein n=1 Tax=Rhizobium rosettiformans TaxID=1368430 RepID=A0ABX7EWH2_9HYPH|nr:nucleotidyltransferase domain-containing protein [Rhizobium rosettiformans]QRF52402.1 nucleotidyltransferase domain-containing protein [Rhizobium rosettiformans]